MYEYEIKKINIYHVDGNSEMFEIGGKYRSSLNTEIIRIEYEHHDNNYNRSGSGRINIYIEYVVTDRAEHPIHKRFFHVIGGDVFIESEKA